MDKRSREAMLKAKPDDPRWRNCVVCHERFFSVHSKVKTCGPTCGYVYNRQRNLQRAREAVPSGVIDRRLPEHQWAKPVIKECVVCKRQFAVGHSQAQHYATCSKECSSIRRKNAIRIHNPITKKCEWCGGLYETIQKGFKHAREHFCSDDCRLKHLLYANSTRRTARKGRCPICQKEFVQHRASQKWCCRQCMWNDVDYVERRSRGMSRMAQALAPTKLERWLFSALTSFNISFQTYQPIGAYIADAYLPCYKVLIEVDGEYWHHQHADKDMLRDRILANRGFTTVRFSDSKFTSEKRAKKILHDGIEQFLYCYVTNTDIPVDAYARVFWSAEKFKAITSKSLV